MKNGFKRNMLLLTVGFMLIGCLGLFAVSGEENTVREPEPASAAIGEAVPDLQQDAEEAALAVSIPGEAYVPEDTLALTQADPQTTEEEEEEEEETEAEGSAEQDPEDAEPSSESEAQEDQESQTGSGEPEDQKGGADQDARNTSESASGEEKLAAEDDSESAAGEEKPAAEDDSEPADGEENPAAEDDSEPADGEDEPAAENISESAAGDGEPAAGMEKTDDRPPFAGSVYVELINEGTLHYGDTVVLRAVVTAANRPYRIRWETGKNGIYSPAGEGETYSFILSKENAGLDYRAVLTAVE